ncbi:MAG: hypothetical protein UZ15_CFX003001689 [Chloroflexi bacterium OLB15]|nr:MAG: hypothetical protein UZ15_CFX003001689 [Chloroflexi bacterium OLB15]
MRRPKSTVEQFLERCEREYGPLPLVSEEGVKITFVENLRLLGWIDLVVIIDEHVTREGLDAAYPLIDEWRERLVKEQGRWIYDGNNQLYEDLYYLQRELGFTYRQMAEQLNTYLIALVDNYGKESAESRRTEIRSQAIKLMEAMGIKSDYAEIWFSEGLKIIADGSRTFPPDDPITSQKVKGKVSYWRSKWKLPLPEQDKGRQKTR